MLENITWLGHATFKIKTPEGKIIYIDPWKIKHEDQADVILISHPHFDHFSREDIRKVSGKNTVFIGPPDVAPQLQGSVKIITPGESVTVETIEIQAVPAYNSNKSYHPKNKNWLGFIIKLGEQKIYYAGDTDQIREMKRLDNIEVALLPIGGTYTMNCQEAAEAASIFKPRIAIPYHWGDIVGDQSDAETFRELYKQGQVVILTPQ